MVPLPSAPVLVDRVTPFPFRSTATVVLFYLAFTATFGPDVVGAIRSRAPEGATERDGGSRWVLSTCLAVSTAGAFWVAGAVPAATVSRFGTVAFGVGLLVMLAGSAFRQYAVRTLGRSFTRSLMTHPKQEVEDGGPYRWVRHPSYTGALASFVGIGLALANWASLLIVAVGAALGYAYRIRVEERVLREELGDPYREYARRTPARLVPYLW